MEATMRIASEGAARALPKRINFTMAALARATCPANKPRVFIYDTATPNLCLMVSRTGAKSFYRSGRVNGVPERIHLGGFPDISVDKARDLATKHAAAIIDGKNPAAERRKTRIEPTIKGLFGFYLEQHAKPHKAERSWQDDQKQYDRYLAEWSNRRLSSIRKSDVAALHVKVGTDNGHYAANRMLALLHKMFNVAIDGGHMTTNPAHGVHKFRETPRARFVKPDELPTLLEAIDAEGGDFADFFRLCLFCGARRGNVQSMRWDEIDAGAAVWTVPGEKAKAHEPIAIPLPTPAMEIIKSRLAARRDDNPWVFPTRSACGHLVEPKTAWSRIIARAKMPGLRVHDLRRTMGSWQAANGASLTIIGKSLGHRNVATTQIYARLDLAPVRQAMEQAATAMAATTTTPAAEANSIDAGADI